MWILWLPLTSAWAGGVEPGPHVMVVEVATESKVPFAGTTQVLTRSLVHLQVSRTETGWTQRQRLCAVEIESDSRATTVLPQAFIDAVPPQSYSIKLGEDGSYFADPGRSYLGFDPKVTGGKLPQKKGDAGVLDMDGDGHPGGTVVIEMPVFGKVSMYVAQAGWSRYHGVAQNGRISGRVESVAVDQRTLGASISAFAANPKIEPVAERSRFFIEPLASQASCAQLAAGWSRSFEAPQL